MRSFPFLQGSLVQHHSHRATLDTLQNPGKATDTSPKLLVPQPLAYPCRKGSREAKGHPGWLVPNKEVAAQSPVAAQAWSRWAQIDAGVVEQLELLHMPLQRGVLPHHAAIRAPCKAPPMPLQTLTHVPLKSLG